MVYHQTVALTRPHGFITIDVIVNNCCNCAIIDIDIPFRRCKNIAEINIQQKDDCCS